MNMRKKIPSCKGIPLEEKIPNEKTLKAMEDLEKGKNVKKFDTAEELFEDLGP